MRVGGINFVTVSTIILFRRCGILKVFCFHLTILTLYIEHRSF